MLSQRSALLYRGSPDAVRREFADYASEHPEDAAKLTEILDTLDEFWSNYDPDNPDHQRQIDAWWTNVGGPVA
jgi:hypothetical protein